MKTWDRWAVKELLQVTGLLLGCAYLLYVLIDYSSRASAFHAIRFHATALAQYYTIIFIRRLDVLLPFAVLIASLRLVLLLNQRRGWSAMMAGRVKLKRLIKPFIAVALLATGMLYLNESVLLPHAMKQLRQFESDYFNRGSRASQNSSPISLRTGSGSLLFYSAYNAAKERLYDVYWISSWDLVFHIEELDLLTQQGRFVDLFKRDSDEGLLQKKESFKVKEFEDLILTGHDLQVLKWAPDEETPWGLLKAFYAGENKEPKKQAELLTELLKKMFFPLLAFFAALMPCLFAIRFERDSARLLFYLVAIFCYIGFYLSTSALAVMGAALVVSPWAAIGIPFALLAVVSGRRYGTL